MADSPLIPGTTPQSTLSLTSASTAPPVAPSLSATSSEPTVTSPFPLPSPRARPEKTEEQRQRRIALRALKQARKRSEAAALRIAALPTPPPTPFLSSSTPTSTSPDWGDGGATSRWGNFHRYYQWNTVEERLQFLTPQFLHSVLSTPLPLSPTLLSPTPPPVDPPPCHCPVTPLSLPAVFPCPSLPSPPPFFLLDVGCNSGDLSLALLHRLLSTSPPTPLHLLGLDIDPALITRAREAWRADCASQPPTTATAEFYHADVVCPSTLSSLQRRLQGSACPLRYDLVCCFSVLMWIHLCSGSAALSSLLMSLSTLACHLLIEWQGWRHYRRAIERRRKAGENEEVWHFHAIEEEWRGQQGRAAMTRILVEGGMTERAVLGKTKWGREVIWFSRTIQ